MAAALAGLMFGGSLVACDDVRTVAEQTFTPSTEGVLTVAVSLPAPGYWEFDAAGEPVGGFEYEIAQALADRFELRLEVIDVPFERIVAGDLGGADLALSQITVTSEREAFVQFSTPYYRSAAGVLARDGKDVRDLKTARDLSWGVRAGTTDETLVNDIIRPDRVQSFADELRCAQAVAAGEVDACLIDLPTALVIDNSVEGVQTVAQFLTDEQWAVALPNGAAHADRNREVVDAGLRLMASDGALDRWADEWLTPLFATDPADVPVIEART